MSKRNMRVTKEDLTLFGVTLRLQHPDGKELESEPESIIVTVERPDLSRPWHAPDWSSVVWNGARYKLTPKQRMVVVALWKAWEEGTHFLSEVYLLNKADSDQPKLSHLFKGSDAWGELIVRGELHGGEFDTFCLTPPKEK